MSQSTPSAKPSARLVLFAWTAPSAPLNLAEWTGPMQQWRQLQERYQPYLMVADLYSLTRQPDRGAEIGQLAMESLIDWLAAGLDPNQTVVFAQSHLSTVPHLAALLANFTAVPWLESRAEYQREVVQKTDKTLETLGFLAAPQQLAAAALAFNPDRVFAPESAQPTLQLVRDIARRANFLYGSLFTDAKVLQHRPVAIPPPEGEEQRRKLHLHTDILLSDSELTVRRKTRQMGTDPQRLKRADPGRPHVCPVFSYHRAYNAKEEAEIEAACRGAQIGCVDCKLKLSQKINQILAPVRDKREALQGKPGRLRQILRQGAIQASKAANETLQRVREGLGLP